MSVFSVLFLSVGFILMIYCFFMLFRNKWVAQERKKIIKNLSVESRNYINHCFESGNIDGCDVLKFMKINYDEKYWSYNKMMIYFWIWDVEKMVNYN
jgi:hypothetical protein